MRTIIEDDYVKFCSNPLCEEVAVGAEDVEELFYKSSKGKDGYESMCKNCRKKRQLERKNFLKNFEKSPNL